MNKTTECPCGAILEVPHKNGEYCTYSLVCAKCKRQATSGNFRTGVISGWMTQSSLNKANAWYKQQLNDAEQNAFSGRAFE
ncbi:MAG: hypothetical protein KAS32_08655 [Candidatus Peribacteraceae bacterium]|nr:hypothetical protein [Candidatus Peribacteraceae bacterium]